MNEPMQNLLKLQTLEFSETGNETTAAKIKALRAKIPPQILVHYDRFQVRGKKGLAAAVNQVCTGCHMRLPLGVIMTLRHEQDLQLCDSCGRYLYLATEVESVPVIETVDAKAGPPPRRRKKTIATLDRVTMGGPG
jgi:predicted  nucleic acid-binding Zn-ribbon protein